MTPDPNPHHDEADDAIDTALLEEALSEATPAELEAKILDLTDPQMLSLLDEALAPEAPSDALTDRILAATYTDPQARSFGSANAARLTTAEPNEPAILARIGPPLRYAAAAAIALAVGLGVYFINQGPDPAQPTLAGDTNTPGTVEGDPPVGATQDDTDWLTEEQFALETDYFGGATDPIADALDSASESLDDVAITRDSLWAELDAFEAFLDEFES